MACTAAPHHKKLHGRAGLFCKQDQGAPDHGHLGTQGAGQVFPGRACLQKDGVSNPTCNKAITLAASNACSIPQQAPRSASLALSTCLSPLLKVLQGTAVIGRICQHAVVNHASCQCRPLYLKVFFVAPSEVEMRELH